MAIGEISGVSSYYAANMYTSISSAYNAQNAQNTQSLSVSSTSTDQELLAQNRRESILSRTNEAERRIDRNDSSDQSLAMSVYGRDGNLANGILDRSSVSIGNPILSGDASSAGLPDNPSQLFTGLAEGLESRNAQSLQSFTQNMERTQEFTRELTADAAATRQTSSDLAELSQQAVSQQQSDSTLSQQEPQSVESQPNNAISQLSNTVSQDTEDALVRAANDFANNFNNTLNTLENAPGQSRQVASIARTMENAVRSNEENLNEIGFSVNRNDGTLSLDEDRFRQNVNENPASIQNLFNQNESQGFMPEVNRAITAAEDTRAVSNAEMRASTINGEQIYTTYQGNMQSSSVASMMNAPVGYFLNRMA